MNLNEFTAKVSSVINNNGILKNNTVLRAVLESVKHNGSDEDYLVSLKEGLTSVNEYIKSDDIASIVASVNEKINEAKASDIDGFVRKVCNEFDVVSLCESIVNSINDPAVLGIARSVINECSDKSRPTYLYLVPVANALSAYSEYPVVKESIDKINAYISNNKEKLIIADQINYIASTKNMVADSKTTGILKQCLFESQYNPDVIALKLGGVSKMGTISTMLESLRAVRNEKSNGFDIGSGNMDTVIYNHIGPVLKEGKNLMLYHSGSFIQITPDAQEKKFIKKTVSASSDVKLYEMTDVYVYNTEREFYNSAKAYEALRFKTTSSGSVSKLRNNTIAFNVNENMNTVLVVNGNVVSDIKREKANGSLVTEGSEVRTCVFNVFDNVDKIHNVAFVKHVVNERRNAKAMVINVGKDFYVYDHVNETKTDVYKLSAYKLYEFVNKKFGYDISKVFGFKVNSDKSKINAIVEQKNAAMDNINKYKEAIVKIDESLKRGLRDEDVASLNTIKASFGKEIERMCSLYESICSDIDACLLSGGDLITEGESFEANVNKDKAAQATEEKKATDEDAKVEDELVAQEPVSAGDGGEKDDGDGKPEDKVNESLEPMELIIPDWALTVITTSQADGLTDVQKEAVAKFTQELMSKYSDGEFQVGESIGEQDVNDIDDIKTTCTKVTFIPSVNESAIAGEFVLPAWAIESMDKNDKTMLTESQRESLESFLASIYEKHGNGRFAINEHIGESNVNDVDSNATDCTKVFFCKVTANK